MEHIPIRTMGTAALVGEVLDRRVLRKPLNVTVWSHIPGGHTGRNGSWACANHMFISGDRWRLTGSNNEFMLCDSENVLIEFSDATFGVCRHANLPEALAAFGCESLHIPPRRRRL